MAAIINFPHLLDAKFFIHNIIMNQLSLNPNSTLNALPLIHW
jgi:hypothetical protein